MGKEMLAKSNGQTLYDHSILVSRFAVEIAKNCLFSDFMSERDEFLDKKLIESVRVAGLLHDIGKCTKEFQNRLKKSNDEILADEKPKIGYRHNEVGWAFLVNHLNLPSEILNLVLDSVYWHHGISKQMSDYSNIHIKIEEEDRQNMLGFMHLILGNDKLIATNKKSKKAPRFYTDEDNHEDINSFNTFVRTCVISADRMASKYHTVTSDEDIQKIVNSVNEVENNFQTDTHIYKDTERFTYQTYISTQSLVGGTVQINAPAGFGKTLLGLMTTSPRKRRLIWVCPRNMVAESVYHSILGEINNTTNNENLKVELYLAGEVKQANHNSNGFDSDIIITNIDNYLSPSVDNRNADKLFTIISSDVIFDEYHELISESALLSCFINIMNVRNKITNSFSLLLSATPIDLSPFWDTLGSETYVLPEKNKHYPSAHDKKYLFKTTDVFEPTESNNLYIFNSIKNAQLNKNTLNCQHIIHSDFTDIDREKITSELFKLYGKESERDVKKPNFIGTHIIQASLDVSFNNLYESVLSPQSTLQRIGRCDRWGDCSGQSSINVVNYSTPSETSIKNVLYTNNLSNIWFDYLSDYNGKELTLDEIYEAYNSFESEHKVIIDDYLMTKYMNSLSMLANIHPVKFFNNKGKSDIKSVGGNKLRVTGNGLFVILKQHDSDEYTQPFSVNIYRSVDVDFHEDDLTMSRIKNTMKMLRDKNDDRFDFNEILESYKYMEKNKKLGKWLPTVISNAKKSNTPYIRFDKVYHPQYGCVLHSVLEQINNK